jgi:hypothetical protein
MHITRTDDRLPLPQPGQIMVGGLGLTDRDVAMLQSLYAAGLGPGATRVDLARAGIVNP